jgi:hypothetical protein
VDFSENLLNMTHPPRSVNLRRRDSPRTISSILSGEGLDVVERGGSLLLLTQLNCASIERKLRTADCRDGSPRFAACVSTA